MITSPLQLEKFLLLSISIEPRVDGNKTTETTVSTTIEAGRSQTEKRLWMLKLSVMLKETPYSGSIVMEGFFRVHDSVAEDIMPKIVAINGASILYGSARDYIALITSRSVNGEFVLPSVSFSDIESVTLEEGNK